MSESYDMRTMITVKKFDYYILPFDIIVSSRQRLIHISRLSANTNKCEFVTMTTIILLDMLLLLVIGYYVPYYTHYGSRADTVEIKYKSYYYVPVYYTFILYIV